MSKSRPKNTSLLSSGKEKSWKKHKPTLAADIDDTGLPEPEEDEDSVKDNISMFFRLIGGLVSLAIFLTIVGWFILGVTILPFIRIGDGVWVTKWAAYPEGAVPQGAMIVSSNEPVQRDFTDRLDLILLNHPEYSVSVVVAGPGFSVSASPENKGILWKDTSTGFSSNELFQDFELQAEYLSLCVAGNCGNPGDYTLIPMRNVLGEAINTYSFPISLSKVPEYPLDGNIQQVVGEENIIQESTTENSLESSSLDNAGENQVEEEIIE